MTEQNPLPTPTPRAVEDAAHAYVLTQVERADGQSGEAPWWRGWALREAYIAGANAERSKGEELARAVEAVVEQLPAMAHLGDGCMIFGATRPEGEFTITAGLLRALAPALAAYRGSTAP